MASADSLESLSSLDRVELMSALESKFHVELTRRPLPMQKRPLTSSGFFSNPMRGKTDTSILAGRSANPFAGCGSRSITRSSGPPLKSSATRASWGRENLRGLRGPVLIVSNHITRRADIGLILAALPPRCRHRLATAMGGESLENMRRPPRDWFFARRWAYQLGYWLATLLFNVFPLRRFPASAESFRFAGESVDRGYSVLVFPEGEVNNTSTGEMAPFQSGIACSQRICASRWFHATRRRLADEARTPPPCPFRRSYRSRRRARRFPPGMSPDEIARRLESPSLLSRSPPCVAMPCRSTSLDGSAASLYSRIAKGNRHWFSVHENLGTHYLRAFCRTAAAFIRLSSSTR